MLQYIARRSLATVPVIFGVVTLVFAIIRLLPGDPAAFMLGEGANAESIAALHAQLGLDRPVVPQFLGYLGGIFHGDLGSSYRTRRPVGSDLATYVPATAELALCGLVLALLLATLFAVATVLRWPGARVFLLLLLGGASAPAFLLAIAGILVFYRWLGWLPATGRTGIASAPTGPTRLLTVDGLLHGRLDVVGDALRLLQLHDRDRHALVEDLRMKVAAGLQQLDRGDSASAAEVFAELRERNVRFQANARP